MSSQQVLCIWLPNWPCQRILAQQSQANNLNVIEPVNATQQQAFVLQVRDPRRGLRVAAADPLAWQLGISPGMSISEATAVAPHIRILDHDPQEDLESLCELAQEAWQFSPMVGLETLDESLWAGRLLHQPQGLVMDATGLDHFFGGPERMIQLVLKWLAAKGLLATAAIHPTLGGAWALANYGSRTKIAHQLTQWRLQPPIINTPEPSPEVSAYGSENQQASPIDDLNVQPIDSLPVDSLPVEALRLDSKTVFALHRLGVRMIRELQRLPRHGLASRLGTRLVDRLDTVIANKSEPLNCFQCPPEFTCQQSLEFATSRRDTIEEILRRLTLELCRRLQHHGQGALRWVACLRCQKGPAHVMALGLYRPTADHQHLWPLVQGQLERQSSSRLRDIHAVTVQAVLTAPLAWKQNDLFDIEHMNHHETMARLIDSLSSRLGRRGVLAPQVHSHPQPELATSWRPLTGVRSNGNPQSTKKKLSTASRKKLPQSRNSKAASKYSTPYNASHGHTHSDFLGNPYASAEPAISDPLRRPLQLYAIPYSIEVTTVRGNVPSVICSESTSSSNNKNIQIEKIVSILFKGIHHAVVQACGPERIESGWWAGASQRRDYYRIETHLGQWWWIYRDLANRSWYLHGGF